MACTGSSSILEGGADSVLLLKELTFARDLLNYVLSEYKLEWRPSMFETKSDVGAFFRRNIGKAIMYQLVVHRNFFKVLRCFMFPLGFWSLRHLDDIIESLLLRRSRCFTYFMFFCTFLCHMCVFCVRTGNPHLVDDIVFNIAFVLGVKLKDNFERAGGWRAFMEFVERRNLTHAIADAA